MVRRHRVANTDDEMFEKQVLAIRRDFFLVLKHLHTLPFVLGTVPWFLCERYRYERPFSELNPKLFPFELCRIVVQAVVSFVPAMAALFFLIVTLCLNWMAEKLYISAFHTPLRLAIALTNRLINSKFFAVRSPIDRLRERRAALRNSGFCVAVPKEGPAEVWIHVNGICEQGAMVDATCTQLKELTGRLVNPFVNVSNGAPLDLLECILGRTFDSAQRPAVALIPRIVFQLAKGRRVVLVAHSQGGIIVSNVVKRLVALARAYGPDAADDDALRLRNTLFAYGCDWGEVTCMDTSDVLRRAFCDGLSRVEVYTFASAADEFEHGPFTEHFAAEMDFVSRIGALHFSGTLDGRRRAAWNGDVFMLRKELGAQGHLMKEMLLPAMKQGVFGQDSVFWQKYCQNGSARHLPVDHHLIEDYS